MTFDPSTLHVASGPTTPAPAAATYTLPLLYSRASRWPALRAFIYDALADAMHHEAALQGARLRNLNLLVSGRHLGADDLHEVQVQLETLSSELRELGVPHAIHRVLPGDSEPQQHQLRITLQRA